MGGRQATNWFPVIRSLLHSKTVELGGIDGRFVHQHNRNVIFDCVDPAALGAFQAFRVLAVFEGLLTSRAHEDFQQILRNHD
jgi:hypothetical protein